MDTRRKIMLVGILSLLPLACSTNDFTEKPFGKVYASRTIDGRFMESWGLGFVVTENEALVTARHVATRMGTFPAPAESIMFFPANTKDTLWGTYAGDCDGDGVIYFLNRKLKCVPLKFAERPS